MAITILDPQFIDALYLQIWNKYLVSSLMCPRHNTCMGPCRPCIGHSYRFRRYAGANQRSGEAIPPHDPKSTSARFSRQKQNPLI